MPSLPQPAARIRRPRAPASTCGYCPAAAQPTPPSLSPRLGTPTRFLARLSHDLFGDLFRARLTHSGVDLSACIPAPEPSSLAVAALDEMGQAAYSFFADGAADRQSTDAELSAAPLDGSACLYTGSLAVAREPGGPRLEEHLATARQHMTISLDPKPLRLLDWEGWGMAPEGFDAATPYAYSLLQPNTAARVRVTFPALGSPAGLAAEATVCAQCSRPWPAETT